MKIVREEYFVPQNQWGQDITKDMRFPDEREVTHYISRMVVEVSGRHVWADVKTGPLECHALKSDSRYKDAIRRQMIESIMDAIRQRIFNE